MLTAPPFVPTVVIAKVSGSEAFRMARETTVKFQIAFKMIFRGVNLLAPARRFALNPRCFAQFRINRRYERPGGRSLGQRRVTISEEAPRRARLALIVYRCLSRAHFTSTPYSGTVEMLILAPVKPASH